MIDEIVLSPQDSNKIGVLFVGLTLHRQAGAPGGLSEVSRQKGLLTAGRFSVLCALREDSRDHMFVISINVPSEH